MSAKETKKHSIKLFNFFKHHENSKLRKKPHLPLNIFKKIYINLKHKSHIFMPPHGVMKGVKIRSYFIIFCTIESNERRSLVVV